MIVLRLSGALGHDPCAALLVDGEIVAAAEEERFVRDKHTRNRMPLEAARYCLAEAGIPAQHVDAAAFPYAPISIFSQARWHYARRNWYAPDRAIDAIESIACTSADALDIFADSDLRYLVVEDFLVGKPASDA